PWTFSKFEAIIPQFVEEALTKDYTCAWYKSKDTKFHEAFVPNCIPNGILFFHGGRCKAHMDLFELPDFVAIIDNLPKTEELTVDTGEDKPAVADDLLRKAYPRVEKDYSIPECVIM
ncbi:hypothetical protein GGI21_005542, partial [Coemansia aciculifera]